MRLSATFNDGVTKLRALLDHPMESGKRSDSRGNLIAANFIQSVVVKLGDRTLISSDWGSNVSKNPYFSIQFEGASPDDEVTIEWEDSTGKTGSHSVVVEQAGD